MSSRVGHNNSKNPHLEMNVDHTNFDLINNDSCLVKRKEKIGMYLCGSQDI